MDIQNLIERVHVYPQELRKSTEYMGGNDLNKSRGEGSWRVREVLHHIADTAMLWFFHLRRILTEKSPKLPGMQQDKLARLADYQLADIRTTLSIIDGVFERLLVLVRNIKEEDWARTAEHEKFGEMNFASALERIIAHSEHHLEDIKLTTGKKQT